MNYQIIKIKACGEDSQLEEFYEAMPVEYGCSPTIVGKIVKTTDWAIWVETKSMDLFVIPCRWVKWMVPCK